MHASMSEGGKTRFVCHSLASFAASFSFFSAEQNSTKHFLHARLQSLSHSIIAFASSTFKSTSFLVCAWGRQNKEQKNRKRSHYTLIISSQFFASGNFLARPRQVSHEGQDPLCTGTKISLENATMKDKNRLFLSEEKMVRFEFSWSAKHRVFLRPNSDTLINAHSHFYGRANKKSLPSISWFNFLSVRERWTS